MYFQKSNAKYFFFILLSFSFNRRSILCSKCKSSEYGEIVDALFKNYTKALPSLFWNSTANFDVEQEEDPVIVTIELHVQDISGISEKSGDFDIDILFSQVWHDPSLNFRHLVSCKQNVTLETWMVSEIWTPNVCVLNSKESNVHRSPTDNIMLIIYENGTVWINYRIRVKAPCTLDLRLFPFDVQHCDIVFESYSYNADEVNLKWFSDQPVTFMNEINLPDFDLSHFITDNLTLRYPNGLWERLKVTFAFKRRFGFYIFQAYIPTFITVVVSWVSFFMDHKALPARTTVGVSSLLALTFQFGNILKNLPPVSYTKAMDVWMLGCISFVFGSMIELSMVCTFAQDVVQRRTKAECSKGENCFSALLCFLNTFSVNPDKIDKFSMLLFPICFALFNILYWWYYLFHTF